MSSPMKFHRKLLKKLGDGWDNEQRNNSHMVYVGPDGQKVFTSLTPSDHRAQKNIERDLRHAGADI